MEVGVPEVAVLLVEDDAIVRAWVRLALAESEFRIAGEASTAGEALELAARRAPAVLLVDHNLPDGTGTELVRKLRAQGSSVPAVLMTAGATGGLNEAARDAGVQGTVVKSGRGDELLTALRTVLDGRSTFDPRHPRRTSEQVPLTPRERDVLRLVAAGSTKGQEAAPPGARGGGGEERLC